ncbi:cobalamin biosynthesis protein CobD [Caldichromatium japonicum]|uniref:Cobalamin biosynthesis protein CobD n=1 Tax=Caldichromatium japonicum TaxID=2699430 RepID=A0A6G7VEV6_9GAMM|nr:adenosylcobinamide-phosphate synthase CbiB [Caldichromatium japonicum]QIK38415.1 cobalamin biosynthesis protein CobD [Caldichromatium japonicum]
MTEHLALVLGACLLDALIGDPVSPLHPVRLIGGWALWCEQRLFALGLDGRAGGVIQWFLVITTALGVWFGPHRALGMIHSALAWGWDLGLAAGLLCTRSLLEQGWRVLKNLDDLAAARLEVSHLVGRDVERLDRAGVVRATLESLSENLTDGVLTPLWALCLFGLPGLIAVKVISTLDSMVGYRNARYGRYGWLAARSDDLIHWLPARLSVLLIALAATLTGGHPWLAIRTAWRDHRVLPSPNSGWGEAACAGALRVRLVGPLWRKGRRVEMGYLGDPAWPVELDVKDLRRGLRLIATAALLAIPLGLGLSAAAAGM